VRAAASEECCGVSKELGDIFGPVLNLLEDVSETPARSKFEHTTQEYFHALIDVAPG
jgi:hypothetical protein